MEGLIIDESLR